MAQILLIDDDPACLEALSETLRLRMTDVVVHAVESAAAGLFLPVLLITGHSDLNVEDRALRLGAYAVIQKPLEREAFVALLVRAVRSATLSRWVREQQEQMSSQDTPSRRSAPAVSLSHDPKGKARCKRITSLT
jgi:DNA-binding NtrC family response regulator